MGKLCAKFAKTPQENRNKKSKKLNHNNVEF